MSVKLPADLALVVEQYPASMAIFDADLRYLAVSRRYLSECESLFSRKLPAPSDVIGCSVNELFPDLPLRWHSVHSRVLASEELAEEEDFVSRTDAGTVCVRWSLKALAYRQRSDWRRSGVHRVDY